MGQRLSGLLAWVEKLEAENRLPIQGGWDVKPVSGDASFRRYFRVSSGSDNWIAVDAPPEKEASDIFVQIANSWREAGISVPEVIAADLEQGYMLLEDFGDRLLLPALTNDSVDALYRSAMTELLKIQTLERGDLPPYDAVLLQREMLLFSTWFVEEYLALNLTQAEHDCIAAAFHTLQESALEQPAVVAHRDYHSRNLMLKDDDSFGVIDFQDAVYGPITYDLVSLLRDCYVCWPDEDVYSWVESYRLQAQSAALIKDVPAGVFAQWFDLMGTQRHLKAIGIFARLSIRDNKHGYLQDIPRTMGYVVKVAKRYETLHPFAELLTTRILPAMSDKDLSVDPYL
ncbi:phosphotransferase [Neptunomonas sp. XY-337]|uniref:aminoglycoside phosphotransferase family protein n=1 Tax=Neptunomonas sp. XY-337 TaxID=2561897 RepID=UPI0010AB0F06|nr:phosphotransferase [Neptunomonas sp. XY-337]